jgi:hypothetical protein
MSKRHYTIDDIESAIEDERAKAVIWRNEAIRELRACLLGTAQGSPRPVAGATTSHGKHSSAK